MHDPVNEECMKCPLKSGCYVLCECNPDLVIMPPCEQYAIGINDINQERRAFWTRPKNNYIEDPNNPNPSDLKWVLF